MQPGPRIDYKALRKVNPPAARQAVLEYLESIRGNVAETARVFGINRSVIYDILSKEKSGSLADLSKAPHSCPTKTSTEVETQVVEIKNKTHFGPKRLSRYLARYESLMVPTGTIRHILRRNNCLLYTSPSPRDS